MTAVTPRAGSHDVTLRMENLTKEFRGFTAVRNLSLDVHRGTIHALIGPNGAGKTTVFNLATKFLSPTSGRVFFKGIDITRMAPAEVARLGMVRSFQISAVFANLTVLENVRIALQRFRKDGFFFWRSERALDELNERARALLNEVGLEVFAERKAIELSYGRRRALEIATTLALDPELLLLDEPMSGLGQEDIGRIADLIRKSRGRPHRPDGRAQPVRRGGSFGPYHRAGARRGPGRWALRRSIAQSGGGRGLSGVGS